MSSNGESKKLSAVALKRVHIALEHTKGNVREAASLLGMSREGMVKIIATYPELKSYDPNAEPPTDAEVMARPPVGTFTKEQEDQARAIMAQDEAVRKGFAAIGVTGDALVEAVAFRDFGRMHFKDTLDFVGGGIAKLFADLMGDVKEARRKIESIPLDNPEIQKILREDRSRLVNHCIQVYDRVREASLTAVTVAARQAEMRRDMASTTSRRRPSFGPLQVNVVTGQPKSDAKPEVKTVEVTSS